MEIKHLKTFIKLTHLMNFNLAAKALNCSQSTVSAQIKALEEELGVLLFDRLGKTITVTDAGLKLLRYAQKMIDIERETISEVTQTTDLFGLISIRAPQTVGTYLIPEILCRFKELYPKISFNIETCAVSSLKDELRAGIVDVAFLLTDYVDGNDLLSKPLRIESLSLIACPGHPLARKKKIWLRDLSGETIILPKHDCGYRATFEKALSENTINIASKIEFNSIEAVKQCVRKGIGITVIPELSIKTEIETGTLISLPFAEEIFETTVMMIWHKNKWLSPGLTAFMDCAKKTIAIV